MKRQTVLITHLCLLAALVLTGCRGDHSPTPISTAGKEISQQALESALATRFVDDPTGLCEWEVWGEAGQEIYLWAICQSAEGAGCSVPAVVCVAQDESGVWRVREVEMPRDGTLYGEDVRALFPLDVQARILAHDFDAVAAWARIEARRDRIDRQATHTPTPTPMPGAVPSDCAGFGRPALVLIPSPAQRTDPASFILTSPDGDAHCTLTSPDVPWSSERCQVVGEHIYYRPDVTAAETTYVLDTRSDTLERLDFTRAPDYQYGDFLVSPGGDWIAWSVGQTGDGGSRSTLFLARVDGSGQRKVLDEHYDDPYHILLVAWTPAGDALFFARRWLVVEGNGGVLPAFQGRHSNLYRLDVETGEVSTVIPLDERPDCWFCVAGVSPDGRWVAYHHADEDGALYLRELGSGDERHVSDGNGDWVAGARFSPDGSHLAYVEVEGHDQPRFTGGRTVMVDVPFAGQAVVLAEGAGVVDWPVGWLDGETPILERLDAEGHLGLWVAGHSSVPDDLLPGMLAGVLYDWREEKL